MTKEELTNFVKSKILNHYSGKQNFLITMQPEPGEKLSLKILEEVHEELAKEKNQPGIVSLTLNANNKQRWSVQILPRFMIKKIPLKTDSDAITDIMSK